MTLTTFHDRLVKIALTYGSLEMCLPVTGWPLLTEQRRLGRGRGGFLTRVRAGLEKHAWWVLRDIFGSFQARLRRASKDLRSSRTLASLSGSEGGSRTCWPNAWDPASHSTATPQEGWHKRGLFALGLRRCSCYKTTCTELCGRGQPQHIGCPEVLNCERCYILRKTFFFSTIHKYFHHKDSSLHIV